MAMRGARTTGRGRFYLDADGKQYWSVTTILSAMPKPALPGWAARTVAEFAADNAGTLVQILLDDPADGRQRAIDLAKGEPWRYRDKRADIGTLVHQAIEAHVTGAPFPEVEDPDAAVLVGHFHQFLADFSPEFEASELTVFNRTRKYAGTLDGIVQIGDQKLLLDIKTSKGVYPEVALQIAMYRHAEFLELPDGTAVDMPETDGGLCLHLTADGYSAVPVRCDDEVFTYALYAREIYRWTNEVEKLVLLEPLVPPTPEEPATFLAADETPEDETEAASVDS